MDIKQKWFDELTELKHDYMNGDISYDYYFKRMSDIWDMLDEIPEGDEQVIEPDQDDSMFADCEMF